MALKGCLYAIGGYDGASVLQCLQVSVIIHGGGEVSELRAGATIKEGNMVAHLFSLACYCRSIEVCTVWRGHFKRQLSSGLILEKHQIIEYNIKPASAESIHLQKKVDSTIGNCAS